MTQWHKDPVIKQPGWLLESKALGVFDRGSHVEVDECFLVCTSTFQFGCPWKTLSWIVELTPCNGTIWQPKWKLQVVKKRLVVFFHWICSMPCKASKGTFKGVLSTRLYYHCWKWSNNIQYVSNWMNVFSFKVRNLCYILAIKVSSHGKTNKTPHEVWRRCLTFICWFCF